MKKTAFAPRSLGEVGPFFKNLTLVIFISFLSFILFTPSALAQTHPQNTTNTNPDVPNNLHNYTQSVMIEVMSAMTCQLVGIDPTNPNQQCLGTDAKTGKIGFVQNGGGAIGVMGNMISTLYTPPLHTKDYFQNLASNFGLTKKAYAQGPDCKNGTGFCGLQPLLGLWSAFRNIVYIVFVIIFVVIGLAIMFRIKIDPRTVMTLQNQIPKIIIGLLLVTFSFAIAGFLIDMMWVAIYLVYGTISGIQLPNIDVSKSISDLNPVALQGKSALSAAGGLGGLAGIAWNVSRSVQEIIVPLLDNPIGKVIGFAVGSAFGFGAGKIGDISGTASTAAGLGLGALCGATGVGLPFLPLCFGAGEIIGKFATTIIGGATGVLLSKEIIGTIATIIAFLIIAIALLFALFRLWFTLLMAYIYILIDVVLAPFWIIGGIIPGSPISFSGWIRNIVANLAAFPATIALFLMGKVFVDAFSSGNASGQFVPPLIGNPGDLNAIGALIGLGIILITPNIVNMLKAALKAPKIDIGSIGQAIGVGTAFPINTAKGIGGIIAGRGEAYARPGPGGSAIYEEKGIGRGILGRIFGR